MAGREQLGFPKMGFPRPGPGRRHSSSDRLTLKYLQIRKCCRLWGNSVAVVSVGFLSPNVLLRQRLHDTRARRPKVFQEKPLLGPNICHKLLDCWGGSLVRFQPQPFYPLLGLWVPLLVKEERRHLSFCTVLA